MSIAQRHLVKEILDKVNPQFHICGHHHVRETWLDGDTEVNVLGRDGMGADSVLILDLSQQDDELVSANTHAYNYQLGVEFNHLLESYK